MLRAALPVLLFGAVIAAMLGLLVHRASRDTPPELVIGASRALHGEFVLCESEVAARRFAVAGWDRGGGAEAPGCTRQDGPLAFTPLRRIAIAFRPRIAAREEAAPQPCVAALTGALIPCFDPSRKDSFFEGMVAGEGGPRRVFVALDARTRLVAR